MQRLDGRHCFHWFLAFPEVIDAGGFAAFVGNPPFLGGRRIRGTLGLDYLEWLTLTLCPGSSGNADLCAFFFRRAFELLRPGGHFGFVATNTISQADTRSVSMDPLVSATATIVRADPDASWPGIAGVNISKVWIRKGAWSGERVLGGESVNEIGSNLTQSSRALGHPKKLPSNLGRAFIGSFLCGNGFVINEDEAAKLNLDPTNNRVIRRYLNGQDLNSRPDQTSSRYAINFSDYPLSRNDGGSWFDLTPAEQEAKKRLGVVPGNYPGPVAADFHDCFRIVEERVKPDRTRLNDDGNHALRKPLPQRWWIYADRRPALYRAIEGMERVLVTAEVSKNIQFSFCPTDQIFSHMLVVFPTGSFEDFAVLQSWIHCAWAWEHCSTMRAAGIRYSPTDAVETFPFPAHSNEVAAIGGLLYEARQRVMSDRGEGLTKLYNRINSEDDLDEDIENLRRLHSKLDHAVVSAYEWQDLILGHGFHLAKQGVKYTICETARREILARLLELNHRRNAEERTVAAAALPSTRTKRSRNPRVDGGQATLDL